MQTIVLASASPRRKELLRQIGIDPLVINSHLDEDNIKAETPGELAEKLALAKAESVAETLKEGLVIGGDTLVVLKNKILGKPADAKAAREMLELLNGDCHEVISGLALVDAATGRKRTATETTRVYFRLLSQREIAGYLACGEYWDKAGAYGIQGMGALLVEKIEGCYYNVVGLPLVRLLLFFKEFGIDLLGYGQLD